jgi:hypothetical protein
LRCVSCFADPQARRFELYATLHALWERHAAAALDAVAPGGSREAALAAVDLHGAMIKGEFPPASSVSNGSE